MNAKLAATSVTVMKVHAPATRPSLSVRCPSSPSGKAVVTELAMVIAEEIASLGRSPQPIGVEVPIIHSGLDPKTLSSFRSWLKSAYDYDVSITRLLEVEVTAEVLAADIQASPRTRQWRTLPKSKPRPSQPGSGSFALSRRSRLPPRAPISVDVTTDPEEIPLQSAAVKQYQIAADIGMAPYDSWANKKTGLVYGLLALGLVGSPMSTSFSAVKSPGLKTPLPLQRMRPIAPLEDPRAVLPARTPLFASFLDSVHMPDVEPIQSPWVADRQFASMDGMLAQMSFPKTPDSL
ncbi:hypothetical protein BD413DRAFT_187572 [Trametes elegans]|nr:hypothetical protein BD413DRAFT_187572 [Trametes elegans]